MTATNVIPLTILRSLRDMSTQLAALRLDSASLRLESDSALRERVYFALLVERRERFVALLGHVAEPLMDCLGYALAQQRAAGEPLDPLRALSLVLGSRRLVKIEDALDAIDAGLPAALLRMPPEVLSPPPTESTDGH